MEDYSDDGQEVSNEVQEKEVSGGKKLKNSFEIKCLETFFQAMSLEEKEINVIIVVQLLLILI